MSHPVAPDPDSSEARFTERVRGQGERVHIPLGVSCNNHCLFCMEENREARARVNGAMTAERVRSIIRRHRGAEELCFTSGEPTLHPRLADYVRWSRQAGFRHVSLMTNGRRLAYAPYAVALARAGLTRVYVSVHGHRAALHDGLTRSPGSFDQTVTGLRNVAALRDRDVQLHTSTVVTRRNVGFLREIYTFLSGIGVHQVVFNALQVNGGAARHFDRLVPRYDELRSAFEGLIEETADRGRNAFLVDVPACVTEGLPDRNRGFVESRLHYEAETEGVCPPGATPCAEIEGVRSISTQDLDAAFRTFGPDCDGCRYRSICPGVYERYATAFGWEELRPVPPHGPGGGNRTGVNSP